MKTTDKLTEIFVNPIQSGVKTHLKWIVRGRRKVAVGGYLFSKTDTKHSFFISWPIFVFHKALEKKLNSTSIAMNMMSVSNDVGQIFVVITF